MSEDLVAPACLNLHTGVSLSCYTRLSTEIGKHGCLHNMEHGVKAVVCGITCANSVITTGFVRI